MLEKEHLPANFYILISARLISVFGTFLSIIAVNVLILQLTGSALWVAIALGVKVFAGMLASPVVGYISDRYNRKVLMISSDLILTAALVGLVILGDNYARNYIVLLMLLTGVFSNLFEVCLSSAMPVILEGKQILKANAIMMGGRNIMIGMSGLLAVVANYIFKDYYSIFIVDASTYLISALALILLKVRTSESRTKKPAAAEKKQSWFNEMAEDYRAVAKLDNFKIIMLFLVVLLMDALASASHNVGWPVFSKILNPTRPMYYYGLIMFCWALGNVAGIYILAKTPYLRSARPEKLYLVFTAVMSAGMIMTFQTSISFIILASAFIAGIGDGTYQTYYSTYIQQLDDSMRGKVFALTGMVIRTGFGAGFILVPIILNYCSVSRTVLMLHSPVIIIILGYLLFLYMKEKQFTPELADEED